MNLVTQGTEHYRRGDAAAAVAAFDEALRDDPRRVEALCSRGAARRAAGDLAGALADLDEALRLDPSHAATLSNRAAARHAAGDLDGAMADVEASLAIRPASAAALSNRGALRMALGDVTGALADFDVALALDPGLCRAYIGRGNARYHRRDPAGYLDHRAAFAIDPEQAARDVVETLVPYCRAPERAIAECGSHLARNPDDYAAYLKRGVILILLGRDDEAEPDLAQFRARNPKGRRNLDRIVAEANRRKASA